MTAGRPRAQQPALAWDYHRAITLVQVLAIESKPLREAGILKLCQDWKVSIMCGFNRSMINTLDYDATIGNLARHALEYSRTQPETE